MHEVNCLAPTRPWFEPLEVGVFSCSNSKVLYPALL